MALARWLPSAIGHTHEAQAGCGSTEPAPPLDMAHLESMFPRDPDMMQEVLALYLASTQPLIGRLASAIAQKDGLAASRAAHEIKGASAYVAALEMADIARAIGRDIREDEWQRAGEGCEKLEPAFLRRGAFVNRLNGAADSMPAQGSVAD